MMYRGIELAIAALSKRVDALEQSREPTGGAAETERTCEIRWDELDKRWVLKCSHPSQRGLDSVWTELRESLAFAGGSWPSLRVANDPREVWLEQEASTMWRIKTIEDLHEKTLATKHGVLLRYDFAKAECAERGWRILREERAEAKDCVVISDYGMNSNPMTLADALAYAARSEAPGARVMRLVPVDGDKP